MGINPYEVFSHNPILRIDPLGNSDAPVYSTEGEFLGTDDEGVQGKAIVMNKEDFTQGMSHKEAESKNLGESGLKGKLARTRMIPHFLRIPLRPDYDGVVTMSEGVEWARAHPNLKKNATDGMFGNATPNEHLYLDASKMNFGSLSAYDFDEENKTTPVNLYWETTLSFSSFRTTYALGSVNIKLLDKWIGTIKVVNDERTGYDWDNHGNWIRRTLIGWERDRTGMGDRDGFPVYIYGVGLIRPIFSIPMYTILR